MAAEQRRNAAMLSNVGEHFSGCVAWAGAKACDFHCGEIVDIVAEETGVLE